MALSSDLFCQVKKYDALIGEYTADSFSYKNISNHVLGQHGIELIVERKESHLFPGVLGIICIGTQIIFTFLNITNDHYEEILDDAVDRKHKASIMYTRPYDFMDEADRNELLEPFFWLGCIQTDRYSVYGPSQVFTVK
ncbi:hypothetical protein FSP39_003813 [Pinctada imbricata]|uniref:Uncharacterized protein n=1 Tax=Pinctada imbricata TaxID=66713 RepID=A0AA88YRY0_PINIB|nr:hypothetical protein FSP39_003813 [Pinctada imbricata]